MKDFLAFILVIVLIVLACLGVTWVAQGNDFFLTRAFSPRYEQVRYDTFKESQSYNDGMVQQLAHYRLEYESADADGKALIRSTIRHDYAGYDSSRLSPDLASFLDSVR